MFLESTHITTQPYNLINIIIREFTGKTFKINNDTNSPSDWQRKAPFRCTKPNKNDCT